MLHPMPDPVSSGWCVMSLLTLPGADCDLATARSRTRTCTITMRQQLGFGKRHHNTADTKLPGPLMSAARMACQSPANCWAL